VTSAAEATEQAASLAASRATIEARDGRTCANQPFSTPGDGPLTRGRFAFASRAQAVGQGVRTQWLAPVSEEGQKLDRRLSALRSGSVPQADGVSIAERETLMRLAAASSATPAQRRAVFETVFAGARSGIEASNAMRARLAPPLADRLVQLAREVGGDPSRAGSADPARAADPAYCWDVVLEEQLLAAARQVSLLTDAPVPQFEFIEGPKATRAAFFGLVEWLGDRTGLKLGMNSGFEFGAKAFLALFASIAVDLGIVFLTVLRLAGVKERKLKPAEGDGAPKPPVLSTILE
jgi:hypothetical protein